MKRVNVTLLIRLLALGLALANCIISIKATASSATAANRKVIEGFLMDARITIHGALNNTQINLSDGHEVPAIYSGESALERDLNENRGKPLALASADFDEDGVADLVCAYAGPSAGILTLHRGNMDSIYPNSRESQRRKASGQFIDSPFLPSAHVTYLPLAAEFIGAGDFDADGHWDVVAAHASDNALYLLSGDGRGSFAPARRIELPGSVTVLAAGEANRADGLADVVVGIESDEPRLLVFEGPRGAFSTNPEEFDLPARANAVVFSKLDDDCFMDIAVAAGQNLLIVYGRDRKLSLDEMTQSEVAHAAIYRQQYPFAITSIATGDFAGDSGDELALLSDTEVRFLERGNAQEIGTSAVKPGNKPTWQISSKMDLPAPARLLIPARVSSRHHDDLIVADRATRQLHILMGDTQITQSGKTRAGGGSAPSRVTASLDTDGEPVSMLPMRLNMHARTGLVILQSGRSSPSVVLPQTAMVFTVTTTADSGPGSLRQAILDANANPGADTINFQIGTGTQTIAPISFLPMITDTVTVDGTTQPGFNGTPIIELNGANAGIFADGLSFVAASSLVRGLVINRFSSSGISFNIFGKNVIENNFIGTDVTGTIALGNREGVTIFNGSSENIIGGTTSLARNIISGNLGAGLSITSFTGSLVQGNFIGTDVTGTADLGNAGLGVHIIVSSGNIIGGVTAGARNVLSGNGVANPTGGNANGVTIFSSDGNLVQGNLIGTDVTGTLMLGNSFAGVSIGGQNNTLGGTTNAARNTISANVVLGIQLSGDGSPGNVIQGNYIGTDITGNANFGNGQGISVNAPNNIIGGAVPEAGNLISGNGSVSRPGGGIFLTGFTFGNVVQGNLIGTKKDGINPLGNFLDGISLEAFNNTIGGTATGAGNTIAFNGRIGVWVQATQFVGNGIGNRISGNSIFSNAGLGIDLNFDGVTANDPGDGDTGANTSQNFPLLASTSTTRVRGTLNSTANTNFAIEFFANTTCDSSGNGEGKTFLGATSVMTDGSGNASFGFTFPSAITPDQFITATATDLAGNTSEFSACVRVETELPASDFDVDGKSDIAVWRPSTGVWFINKSTGGTSITGWGVNGDQIVPGDYDGDGKADLAVWRPSTGVWFILNSSNGSTTSIGWGVSTDMPVPGDYDGDNKTDIAVWRPSGGTWFIRNSSNGSTNTVVWGTNGDLPVPANYDGDAKTDIAVWRPSTGEWFIIKSSNSQTQIVGWGLSGDKVVSGDYDGDGKTDIAVWRPSNGVWFVLKSSDGSTSFTGWGTSTDVAVPGDYDGDGKVDIAVWRPSSGTWFILKSSDGLTSTVVWGVNGDVPIPSVYVRP